MAPQIRLLQNNDSLLADKIHSALVNTLPLWKSQMVLALGLENSRSALKASQAVSDATEAQIFANLRREAAGSVVLLISHRLYLFPELDQVIWMNEGKTQTGTHEELMRENPEYAELFREQEGGARNEEK